MNEIKEWFIIVNPQSNGGNGRNIWNHIEKRIEKENLNYKNVFTRYPLESIEIVNNAVREGWRNFIAVGGDGTINEVINGVFTQEFVKASEITFAMIPTGTGNDWGKTIGIPADFNKAIDTIIDSKTKLVDAGIVEYQALNMKKRRFLINVGGVGYDASVVEEVNKLKEAGCTSKSGYLKKVFSQLGKYESKQASISIDGVEVYNGKLLSCCVGVGKYNGNGLMQLPHAGDKPGKFAVTVIKDLSKFKFLFRFPKLLKGKILDVKEVDPYFGEEVRILSNDALGVEVDGEYIGYSDVKFTVIPNAIRVVVS